LRVEISRPYAYDFCGFLCVKARYKSATLLMRHPSIINFTSLNTNTEISVKSSPKKVIPKIRYFILSSLSV
jgi:hypothetical protein